MRLVWCSTAQSARQRPSPSTRARNEIDNLNEWIVSDGFQVPSTTVPGQYRLRVEGNTDRALGGTAFLNETILNFSQRSMTILIQIEKPVYHHGQTGESPGTTRMPLASTGT